MTDANDEKLTIVASPEIQPFSSSAQSGVDEQATMQRDIPVALAVPLAPEKLVKRTRDEYATEFSLHKKRTAEAIIAMCRIVYEADQCLEQKDFEEFCAQVGLASSSSLSKCLCIGRAAERLRMHIDKLPPSWTSLYTLTQLPDKELDKLIESKATLVKTTGSELKALAQRALNVPPIGEAMWKTPDAKAFVFGHLHFVKAKIDTIDYLAIKKAIQELELRLPVKFVINKTAEEVFDIRRQRFYEKDKREYKSAAFEPHRWEFGTLANSLDERRVEEEAPSSNPTSGQPQKTE